jgi:hypothetical protein
MQNSEQALVPLPSAVAGDPRAANEPTGMPWLLAAAAFGLAVEAQRRSLDAAVAVAARFKSPFGLLGRPTVAFARGSIEVARHHLDLDRWAARGLAEQRRTQEVAVRVVRALIAGLAAAILDEIDVDKVVARVDLDRIVERLDLDQIAARIDLDAAVARVDVDAVVARVDLPALTDQVMNEVDLGEIVRESSSTMASETVDALRVQGMRADGLVNRIVDRILLRQGQRRTGPLLDEPRP